MWFIVRIMPSRFLFQGQQIIITSLCDQHEREFGKWMKGTGHRLMHKQIEDVREIDSKRDSALNSILWNGESLSHSGFVRSRVSRKNQKSLWATTFQRVDVLASRISAHHAQNKLGSRASGGCRSLMMTFWRRARCVTLKQEHSKTIHCLFLPLKSLFTGLWWIRSPTKLSHTHLSLISSLLFKCFLTEAEQETSAGYWFMVRGHRDWRKKWLRDTLTHSPVCN